MSLFQSLPERNSFAGDGLPAYTLDMNTIHALPSYLEPTGVGSWGVFLQQVDRASSSLGELAYLVETLKRPKRILIVDVPIKLDEK